MKTCVPSPSWEGGPFADAMDYHLWLLGHGNNFDTLAEAHAAVADVIAHFPELASLALDMVEV